ncbi:hypothetical protein [Streptomyces sp. NPDC127190]|uniref:hypothetical protein n=1 Tax=unclassified Streptomyces TaxID=2593676 RepID=UPI00362C6303
MHRTTTTAALLVTMAVSALTGCMTVPRPAPPGPPPASATALPPVPRPDGSGEPRVVQAPAREALEMVGPYPPHPKHSGPATPHRPAAAPPAVHHPHIPAAPAAPAAPPRPRARPHHPHHHHRRTHTRVPGLPRTIPKTPDVCALGRQYGGWRKDSPEAVICEETYGR